jgi:hypothetical protein
VLEFMDARKWSGSVGIMKRGSRNRSSKTRQFSHELCVYQGQDPLFSTHYRSAFAAVF